MDPSDSSALQTINTAIWSSTSMLLDDCEQVVAQLRSIRHILEQDGAHDSQRPPGPTPEAVPQRRQGLADPPPLPLPLPRLTAPAGPSCNYYVRKDTVKRVRVLSPEDTMRLDRSTPLRPSRPPRQCSSGSSTDPFTSPRRRACPAIIISSESDQSN